MAGRAGAVRRRTWIEADRGEVADANPAPRSIASVFPVQPSQDISRCFSARSSMPVGVYAGWGRYFSEQNFCTPAAVGNE